MITLYSTNCPKCNILSQKLKIAGVDYTINTDIELMQNLGFTEAPMLEIDGRFLGFVEACNWVNNLRR